MDFVSVSVFRAQCRREKTITMVLYDELFPVEAIMLSVGHP